MANGTPIPQISWGGLYTAIGWFLFGLFMSMGWGVGANVLNFIGQFFHGR